MNLPFDLTEATQRLSLTLSMRQATQTLAAALPDARVVELLDQAHTAHATAPELVAAEVLEFLAE